MSVFFNAATRKYERYNYNCPYFYDEWKSTWAEAVAIKNNGIIYVGSKNVFAYKDNDTHVIENPNGLVLPGFIDNHVHLIESGIEFSGCQLAGLKNENNSRNKYICK